MAVLSFLQWDSQSWWVQLFVFSCSQMSLSSTLRFQWCSGAECHLLYLRSLSWTHRTSFEKVSSARQSFPPSACSTGWWCWLRACWWQIHWRSTYQIRLTGECWFATALILLEHPCYSRGLKTWWKICWPMSHSTALNLLTGYTTWLL